ncbi:MAG: 3D-(3,5/4)-trihydroxycyclohexane-1,2-dione acylhydrolase (decyclizing) [Clostridiales Family XIII bacterium]|jgi:3D-(3,5/4)-trihydroxycyclohexane-1,2-dione acylhydrolase (decyclizing)|nr:3D-(3,5/4)-trihydroxycyclohexane-1,2-dione acylhydrolase (decyclizing) [Clostridiales Family XIII bacterium]
MATKKIRLTVGQALVKFLNNQYLEIDGDEHPYVEGVFAILGHGNVTGFGQGLQEDPGHLRVYQGRNEQGMAHAAMSFAKQTNRTKIIACTSSVGPGAANMVTAAATATVNNVPLLLFPSDTFATRQPDPVLQQYEQKYDLSLTTNDAFRPVARYWDRVTRPEILMSAMINAMRALTDTANTGAVVICLPQDVQGETFDYPEYFFEKRVHHIPRRVADAGEIARAVEILKSAKRPYIIAGGGVRYSLAGEAIEKWAVKLGIPYTETQAGKSSTKSSNPFNMGVGGVSGTLAGNEIATTADVVFGIGTRFNDFVTGSKEIFRAEGVKFVALNTAEFDAEKLDATRVVGDALANIEVIFGELDKAGYKTSDAYLEEIKKIKADWAVEHAKITGALYTGEDFVPCVPSSTDKIINDYIDQIGGTITESNGVAILREEIDEDAIVVAAAGSLPADLARLWTSEVPYTYNMEYGYSCMGYEIAGALGSKIAEPDREVYALVGDGSFMMLHSEIPTAIQENKKITVVVYDNTAFGCINNLQMGSGIESMATEMRYRNEETGLLDGDYVYTDFAKIGEGYGMVGYTAKTPEEFRAAVIDAKKQSKSCLIDAKTLPKTMAEGYLAWWHYGVASTSKSEATQKARAAVDAKLENARMY